MILIAFLLLGLPQDERCIDCHEDQAAEVKNSLHEKAGVGCVSCHGTDEIVNGKHKRTASFKPGRLPQVAELCGSCHKGVLNAFRPSDHYAAAAKNDGDPKHRSSCSACHEYHTTPLAHSSTILTRCAECHGRDSSEVRDGVAFFDRLFNQGSAAGNLAHHLDRLARTPGVRISDLDAAREQNWKDFQALKIAQHGLDWKKLNADVDASAERVNESYKMLADREQAFGRRYFGLGIFLVLLALSAILVVRRARAHQGAA